jgi:hypothetical protein
MTLENADVEWHEVVGFQGRTSSFPNIGGEMLGVVAFQVSCGV